MKNDTTKKYEKNRTECLQSVDDEVNILLIDDKDVICKYISKILRRHLTPCNITTLNSAYAALGIIENKKQNFHLILVDTTLPKKETECFIEGIRSIGNETPVILLALSEMHISYEQIVGMGADGILYKPILVDELLNEIKQVLIVDFDNRGTESKFHKIPKFENL